MFAKFKSALYNVVGNFDPTEGGMVGNLGSVSLAPGFQNIPTVIRQNSNQGKEKTVKFPYSRPYFLQLNSEDEISVTADHAIRPIVCPRDISRLPWNSGYAETINAGKSKRNEDQSAVHVGLLTRCVNPPRSTTPSEKNPKAPRKGTVNGVAPNEEAELPVQGTSSGAPTPPNTLSQKDEDVDQRDCNPPASHHPSGAAPSSDKGRKQQFVSLPYFYFGVFDGHAGWGAAVSAANQLHHIIHEKLCDVIELIIPNVDSDDGTLCGPLWSSEKCVSPESAIIGALEQAFWIMDQQIGEDRQTHNLSGGCTACVALFILGKVFVSNAGDSRGIIGLEGVPLPMSFDFTPETETQRIRKIGARHPELLGGEFTHLEFLRRPLKSDVGKKAPFRDHYMKGWSLKTITETDLKYPLVCGEGKRSRVLATIGVTRGFGDHDLKAQFSSLPIKPFLSPEPEVRVFDLMASEVTDKDVLILGTDGLWDIMSNDKAVSVVCNSLQQFPANDLHRYRYRYASAAHDLVLWSRGRLKEHNWRTIEDKHATIDDISVFVIPLKPYKEEFEHWQKETVVESSEVFVDGEEEAIAPSEVIMIPPQMLGSSSQSTETVAVSPIPVSPNADTVPLTSVQNKNSHVPLIPQEVTLAPKLSKELPLPEMAVTSSLTQASSAITPSVNADALSSSNSGEAHNSNQSLPLNFNSDSGGFSAPVKDPVVELNPESDAMEDKSTTISSNNEEKAKDCDNELL